MEWKFPEGLKRRISGRALMRQAQYWIPGLILLVSVGFRILSPAGMERLQHPVFDVFQRNFPRDYQEAPIRVLDLDDATLERLGQWPWPRTLLAEFVTRVFGHGAGVLTFDMVFPEPDRTSPGSALTTWKRVFETGGFEGELRKLPDHDAVFGETIAQGGVVLGISFSADENGKRPEKPAAIGWTGASLEAFKPSEFIEPNYSGAIVNLPVLEKAAAGVGAISIQTEADGIIRRAPMLFKLGGQIYPSLSAETWRVAVGGRGHKVRLGGGRGENTYGLETGISAIQIGKRSQGGRLIPTDPGGRIWVHFTESVPSRTIPVWEIFEESFDSSRLEGMITLLGTSATGLKDIRATPLSGNVPGVEVHANLLEQFVHEHYLERPDWADGAEILYMLVLGVALIVILPRLGALWTFFGAAATVLGVFALSVYAFKEKLLLVDPVFPSVVVGVVYFSSSLITYLRTESERSQVRGAFSRYMSPALVEQLAEDPGKLKLGGEMRSMTLMFCDVRGFTTISEQFTPEGLTQLINRFLTPMTEIILERKGTIDKYMGDCIMAFWNAPIDDVRHAANGCRSALAMMEKLDSLNGELKAWADEEGRKHVPINIGIGLNSGDCCVGNMGSDQRFDYSVLGDDVNLASRLEGQSKNYGVHIVIGPRTAEEVPEFAVLELDLIRVKGKTVPVHIFALLGDEGMRESKPFQELRPRHEAMLQAYREQHWDVASEELEACLSSSAAPSKLYDLYRERIQTFRDAPPGDDWDGVFTATTK